MDTSKCYEMLEKVKEELRNQVSLWSYQLSADRAMNLSLQRKAESAIDKAKFLQKIRIKHVERLLNEFDAGNPHNRDLEGEIRTYWAVVYPAIREALQNFREMNRLSKFADDIDRLEVPESLYAKPNLVFPPETDFKSEVLDITRSITEYSALRSTTECAIPRSTAPDCGTPRSTAPDCATPRSTAPDCAIPRSITGTLSSTKPAPKTRPKSSSRPHRGNVLSIISGRTSSRSSARTNTRG